MPWRGQTRRMTTIAPSPTRRFWTVNIRTDDANPGLSSNRLVIAQDTILHAASMCIGFTCPLGTFATVSVGNGRASSGFTDGTIQNDFMLLSWSNLHATVTRPTGSFNIERELGGMLLPAGSELVVTRITSQSAGQSSSVVGTVSVMMNTLSEWEHWSRRFGK